MCHSTGSDSTTVQGSGTGETSPPTRSRDPSDRTMQTTSMAAPTRTTGLRRRATRATTSSRGMPR